jgi:hypothetical protein
VKNITWRVGLLACLIVLIPLALVAQNPPQVSGGTVTGTLHGSLNGGVLTITSPGAPGTTPVLAGANLANPVLAGTTGSIGGGSLAAGACATGTATIAGAAVTMVPVAAASTSGYPGAGFAVLAQVTAANTVTVSVCALVSGTPTASTYLVRVIT